MIRGSRLITLTGNLPIGYQDIPSSDSGEAHACGKPCGGTAWP
jgi:hypothetical protein